jgi:hypothetical protein
MATEDRMHMGIRSDFHGFIEFLRRKDIRNDKEFPELEAFHEKHLADWFLVFKRATVKTVESSYFLTVVNAMVERWSDESAGNFKGFVYDSQKHTLVEGEGLHEYFMKCYKAAGKKLE